MAEHNQQFDTFDQWVNKASSWLTRHPLYNDGKEVHWRRFTAICFDTSGTIVRNGGDMQRAHDEGKFPIRWVWPDQVPELVLSQVKEPA